ncbi:N-acetylmuramoyl-L-alanine amidase [Bacillus phage Carmen17]|uniref:N-acetylmuramoyl-L-alanine amidase n=1 Tax=Bacillus phage Carmen17 TaxID=2072797 RepID=A0A2I7QIN4_9CAUD|nr:endolysin [Bacillus phage Carmen17]AUR81255.1 N-acetylmuramoyl-L-alanine amidase [Bacillus phage Carmen17]
MAYNTVTYHAGHTQGGGARGSGYEESAVARQFAPVLAAAFAKVGQRTVDCTDNVSTTQNANINRLISLCNAVDSNGRLDISLHFNASDDASATGVEVLYYDQVGLAGKVSAAIAKAAGYRDRGPKERKDLGVLRGTNAPAILIELAFITNADDMRKFFANMQAIANAIVQAVTGKTVSGGGSVPNSGGKWVLKTGGVGVPEAQECMNKLAEFGTKGSLVYEGNGIFYVITEPVTDRNALGAINWYFADYRKWFVELYQV